MKKTFLLLLATMFISSPVLAEPGLFGYDLEADINRNNPKYSKNKAKLKDQTPQKQTVKSKKQKTNVQEEPKFHSENTEAVWEDEGVYYPEATMKSAVQKYKTGNYSGALQELISLTKKDPSNPVIYYYLGMSYTQVGNQEQAVKAYETVIKLNSDQTLVQYATRGRDCLVGGPTCATEENVDQGLQKFVESPYGNGLSDEINQNIKKQQLKQIKNTINQKPVLDEKDIDKIQDFDDNQTERNKDEKIAVTDKDVLSAIETLKNAGITISVNPYPQPMMQNNEYAQLQMLFGNNNNNDSMMSMLPYLMSQNQSGKNIDPQIFQSMMMNSMIPDFTFNDKRD